MSTATDLSLIIPEIALLLCTSALLIASTVQRGSTLPLGYLGAQATLVLFAVLVVAYQPESVAFGFQHAMVSDPISIFLKLAVCLAGFIAFIYSNEYLKQCHWYKDEYYVLGLFALLGMMVIISAHSLLLIYLGIELLSLSLYAMVALNRDSSAATEAAMKYFILGAVASGLLLYGISIIYGVTGTLELGQLSDSIQTSMHSSETRPYLIYGMVFVLVGVLFKLGAAPFHMWIPDVYHGAPVPVTLFLSSAPKIAAFAIALRLLVDGMAPLIDDWSSVLSLVAILSIAVGNVIAIVQDNIKRMFAYSAIAHAGFMLLGFVVGGQDGLSSAMFYIIVYAFMSLGSFGMIVLLSNKDIEAQRLADFQGLNQRCGWFALIMLCLMFSMAGIPPFLGFWAKWFVLKGLVNAGFIELAVAAVVFSVIGAFYYLRIIKLIYFDQNTTGQPLSASLTMRVVLSVNGLLILLLGLFPHLLISWCVQAFSFHPTLM